MAQKDTITVHDFRNAVSHERRSYQLACPVFFVGFMGAGKTSVVRKLARMAGVVAVDLDTYLVRRTHQSIQEIFEESGEPGFRALETTFLRELASMPPQLIACGGGVVVTPANRLILNRAGSYVVYLKTTADEAASRIRNYSRRPLFNSVKEAARLEEERSPLYEEVANLRIETAQQTTSAVAHKVFEHLQAEGVLWQRE